MQCSELEKLAALYGHRRLRDGEMMLVEEHAGSCPPCEELLAGVELSGCAGMDAHLISAMEVVEIAAPSIDPHLALCRRCADDLRSLRAVTRLARAAYRAVRAVPLGEPLVQRILGGLTLPAPM